MEVHHHPHTEGKRLKHYLFEFFMLFLAVFCGFLAENFREHQVEKKREKQYMKSLIEDLRSDTNHINQVISIFSLRTQMEDSLKEALLKPDVINDGSIAYRYIGYPLLGSVFQRSEGTINQLKNAGGWRLLHSIGVTNRLNAYDEAYRRSEVVNQLVREHYLQYVEILYRVANAELINQPYNPSGVVKPGTIYNWNTDNPRELKSLYNAVTQLQYGTNLYLLILKGLHERAMDLIQFLKKEYLIE